MSELSSAQGANPQLRQFVLGLLLRQDPMNLNYGGAEEAYAPDANAIVASLNQCRCQEDVCSVVYEELRRSFGTEAVGSRTSTHRLSARFGISQICHRKASADLGVIKMSDRWWPAHWVVEAFFSKEGLERDKSAADPLTTKVDSAQASQIQESGLVFCSCHCGL